MNNNNISYLGGICAYLTNLQYLVLNNNQISDLPVGMLQYFQQLLHLDLNNNRIPVLRKGIFSNLPHLEYLYLNSNNMSDPTGICACDLPQLRRLDLSKNKITNLPGDCFERYKKLEFMDISCNRFSSLSIQLVASLELLKFVNASNNVLKSINSDYLNINRVNLGIFDPAFRLLVNIQWIDFSRNQLSSLDAWILLLAQRCGGCVVNFSYNNIKKFTDIHRTYLGPYFYDSSLPYSITLDLKENNIRYVADIVEGWNFENPVQFWGSFKNKYEHPFIVRLNSLTCDCRDFAVKQYITQDDYNLDLTQAICSAPANLRNRSISALSIHDMVCSVTNYCPSKCRCTDQPSTKHIIVNCTDAGLMDLPTHLPALNSHPGYKYYLVLSKNRISRLIFKDYMADTKRLDVSSSAVEVIDPYMWKTIQTMSNVSHANNLLTQFPEVPHGSFTGIQLDIQNNPISCDCKNKWLKSWLESIDKKILNLKGINCNTPEWLKGKSVILLQEEDFCSDPPYTLKDVLSITIPTIGGLILLSVIVVLSLRTFRFKIFKYTKIHLFDRDECEGENMDYDVFLSRSSEDEEFAEELIALLEREGYTVCYPDRDFMPGSIINDNIVQSIYKCKRVMCLLTKDFVQSNYCMEEFRIARLRDLEMGKKRTILLLKEPVQHFRDDETVPNDVRDYIRRHTCIEKENVDWEDQIRYAMTERRMLNVDETRFDGNMDLTDGEPSFEMTLPDEDDRMDRQRLLNSELQ